MNVLEGAVTGMDACSLADDLAEGDMMDELAQATLAADKMRVF